MIDREPVVIVRDVLVSNWDASNTAYPSDPDIHTGWYDFGSANPQVTVTNPDEGPDGGGQTGYSHMDGAGSVGQLRSGTMLVNGWAGSREDLEGEAADGSDINPKILAWDFAKEIARILSAYADGTADPTTGDLELQYLAPGDMRRLVDTEPDNAVFRYEVTARYGYDR